VTNIPSFSSNVICIKNSTEFRTLLCYCLKNGMIDKTSVPGTIIKKQTITTEKPTVNSKQAKNFSYEKPVHVYRFPSL
jgi:hypothetical protein